MFNGPKVQFRPERIQLPAGRGELMCIIDTTHGSIAGRLYEEYAPITVANFVGLATGQQPWVDPRSGDVRHEPLYPGTTFHRVEPDFMIQGGDPVGDGTGGPGYEFRDEFHPRARHDRPGIFSMANSGRHTNGSQFFITEAPVMYLDRVHSAFGIVVNGMDVVREIARVPRDRDDKPQRDVVIHNIQIFRK